MALLHPVVTNERSLGDGILPLHLEMYVDSDNDDAMFLNGPSSEQVRVSEALSVCAPPSSSSIAQRMQQPLGPREQWLCTTCGAHFATMFCLREHAKTHESATGRQEIPRITVIDQDLKRAEFVCRCRVCDKQFTTLNDLEKHMHTHATSQMLQCTICKKEFVLPESLDVHMWTHIKYGAAGNASDSSTYSKSTKLHTCDTCKKTFRNGSYFQLHLRTHTGDKLYSCQMCGKSFSCSWNLKTHLAVHRDEKPFICSICGVGFKLKANMQRHERSHQPYERMAFFSRIRNPNNLQDQSKASESETAALQLQQSGDKKSDEGSQNEASNRNFLIFGSTSSNTPGEAEYGCSLCGKTFSTVELLKFHVNEHIPDRPYSCSRCNMGFKVKANLVRHERLHIPPVQSSQSNNQCSNNEQNAMLSNNVRNGNNNQMQMECFQQQQQQVNNLVSENNGKLVELLPNAISNSSESNNACISMPHMNKDMMASTSTDSMAVATKEIWRDMSSSEASAMAKNGEMRCFQSSEQQQRDGMNNMVQAGEKHPNDANSRSFLPRNVEPNFDCSLCGKTFPTVEVLKLHLTEHAPDRPPYSCSRCGMGFKVKANLIRHERLHVPQMAHSGLSHKESWKNGPSGEGSSSSNTQQVHHDNDASHLQVNCFQQQQHENASQMNARGNVMKNMNESGLHENQRFSGSNSCITLTSLNKSHTPSPNVSMSQSKEGRRSRRWPESD